MPLRLPHPLGALLLASAALPALAHQAPFCQCAPLDARTIRCTAGFSGDAPATGVPLEVIAYDQRVLVAGRLDEQSSFTFRRPDEPFYILFDAGPGYTVEIDHQDL